MYINLKVDCNMYIVFKNRKINCSKLKYCATVGKKQFRPPFPLNAIS